MPKIVPGQKVFITRLQFFTDGKIRGCKITPATVASILPNHKPFKGRKALICNNMAYRPESVCLTEAEAKKQLREKIAAQIAMLEALYKTV